MKNQKSTELLIHGDIKYFVLTITVSVITLIQNTTKSWISALQEWVDLVWISHSFMTVFQHHVKWIWLSKQ